MAGGGVGWRGWDPGFLRPASCLEEVAPPPVGSACHLVVNMVSCRHRGGAAGLVDGAAPPSYFLGVELEGSRPLFFSEQQPPDTLPGQVSPLLS